jgi:protoporphyrinogen/coproporphyrinogen III oxidase
VRKRVVIVGGGISGLATAHALLQRDADVKLFEACPRVGGNVRTLQRDGYLIDEGPDSWVTTKPHATALAKSLGLGDRLIETIPENRRVYMRTDDALVPLPDGLMLGIPTRILPLATTPLLSLRGKARAALDLILPIGFHQKKIDEDESLGAFVERRLGREVLDQLVAPLLGGLYTGDVEDLSLLATFPQLAALEQKGGLIRGALAMAPKKKPGGEKPSGFLTLRGGVGELIETIAARLGDAIHRENTIARVTRENGEYLVEHARGTERADHVVVAGPAHVASRLFAGLSNLAADELGEIPYSSAATVFLAYPREAIAHPLDATGYLVPKKMPGAPVASTWVTSKWPSRAPEGKVLVRLFFGASDVDRSDDELIAAARAEMKQTLNVLFAPELVHVARFRRASPQPRVGHLARMRRIATALSETSGLHALGSAYDGVGLGDCVRQAESIADRIAKS